MPGDYFLLEVAVGRRNNPHVDPIGFVFTDAFEFTLLRRPIESDRRGLERPR